LGPKSQIIQEIDLAKSIARNIYVEPTIGWVGNFSYSHDMKEIILVDVNGIYLESHLYHLDESGNRTNITTEFQRADFPSWSPKENVVAFLGTKPYSGSDDPKNWKQIENLFDYPWKLYLYNPENQKIDELSIEVVHPGRFKWSPDGSLLAFTGKYKGVPGVWLIANLDTPQRLKVTRIVDNLAVFDFSPDSKSLVFTRGVYNGQQDAAKQGAIM
jgi:Tol biopolymer transport system component